MAMTLKFWKMNGAGNDFVMLDNRDLSLKLDGVKFETLAGMIAAEFFGDHVRINMSPPHSLNMKQTLDVSGSKLQVHSINTGVPHAVVFVDDLDNTDVLRLGSGLRYHEAFA